MKKILALILAVALPLALAACGTSNDAASSAPPSGDSPSGQTGTSPGSSSPGAGPDGGGSSGGGSSDNGSPDSGSPDEGLPDISTLYGDDTVWTGEISKIVLTYLYLNGVPQALQEIQDAVNEISIRKIGVEVELRPYFAVAALTQFPLLIGNGEKIDLMMLLIQDVNIYRSQGLIDPLDDLIAKNAPYITGALNEFPMADGTYGPDGKIYGISLIQSGYGASGGYVVRQDLADETGFAFDKDKIYTMQELTDLLRAIKVNHPDMYPCAATPNFGFADGIHDALGESAASGALIGTTGTVVTNIYGTPEYEAFVRLMRQWYLEGLIYPDAVTTTSTNVELVMGGVGAGYFIGGHPLTGDGALGDIRLYQLQLSEPYVVAQGAIGGFWTVPYTSPNPDAAMRFLDLTFGDHEVSNLLLFGIEGEHYVMLDESTGLIGFPDGVNEGTSTYYNTLGLYGDRRYEYAWTELTVPSALTAYGARALANPTQGVGFVYDATNTEAQINVIRSILTEFTPSLESGSVDIDTVLPMFLSRLENAGMGALIADKQAQFDAWRAGR